MIRAPKEALAALAAASLPLCAVSCRRRPAPAPAQARQVFTGLTLNQSRSGRKIWSLTTSTAAFDQSRLVAALAEPKMDFYKDGALSSTLTADSGVLYTQTRDVHMEGDVVARSFADKTVLKTSALDYVAKTGRFVTREKVVITRPSGTVRGDGMEADSDFSRIKIFHQRSVLR